MKNEIKAKKVFSCFAFASIMFVAIALIFFQILNWVGTTGGIIYDIAIILKKVAEAIAYFVTIIVAYNYVKSKRNVAYLVLYVIATVLVFVFLILPIFI